MELPGALVQRIGHDHARPCCSAPGPAAALLLTPCESHPHLHPGHRREQGSARPLCFRRLHSRFLSRAGFIKKEIAADPIYIGLHAQRLDLHAERDKIRAVIKGGDPIQNVIARFLNIHLDGGPYFQTAHVIIPLQYNCP